MSSILISGGTNELTLANAVKAWSCILFERSNASFVNNVNVFKVALVSNRLLLILSRSSSLEENIPIA